MDLQILALKGAFNVASYYPNETSPSSGNIVGTVLVVDTSKPKTCKCGNEFDLQKYRGKYYCTNCLDKKLRWG
jgi:hypothetical protein